MDLAAQLDRKRQLEGRINEIRIAIGSSGTELDRLRLVAQGKRAVVRDLELERSKPLSNVLIRTNDVALAQTQAEEAERAFELALSKKNELEEESKILEYQLAQLSVHAKKADLIRIQDEKRLLTGKINKIKTAIAAETADEKPYLLSPDHPLSLLMEERDAILADIAIGELGGQGKLEAVNKKIEEEEKNISELLDSSIVSANTVEGLMRKLADCHERLADLEQHHKDAFFIYLSNEMELAGAKSAVTARELGDQLSWMIAASHLLKQCGTPKTVVGIGDTELFIPGFVQNHCRAPGVRCIAANVLKYVRVRHQDTARTMDCYLDEMGLETPLSGR